MRKRRVRKNRKRRRRSLHVQNENLSFLEIFSINLRVAATLLIDAANSAHDGLAASWYRFSFNPPDFLSGESLVHWISEMYEVLRRVKSRDAALLFCWMKRRTSSKTLRDVGFEAIAKGMKHSGLKTSRGAAFTARVIRERLGELEGAGLIERDVRGEDFDVYLRDAAPIGSEENANSSLDFDDENGNENGNENGLHTRARNKENIFKINKQINNHAGKNLLEETKGSEIVAESIEAFQASSHKESGEKDARPTSESVLQRVNFQDPRIAAFRAKVVAKIWERELNPELVDRLVAAAVLKLAGFNETSALGLCRDAVDERTLFERTNGRAGKRKAWQTIGYGVKRVYETAGYAWTPTRIGNEPAPRYASLLPTSVVDAPSATERVASPQTSAPRCEPSDDENALYECFTRQDLDGPIEEMENKVRELYQTRNALETRMKTFLLRGRLRDYFYPQRSIASQSLLGSPL